MSTNPTLNETTVITIADNVDADLDSEKCRFQQYRYLLLFTAVCKTLDVLYICVCAFVYYKQSLLGKYDELWSTPSGSTSVIRTTSAPATMAGNFRYMPEAQKKLVVTMSLRGMEVKDIELATGIHCCSIQRFINLEINW